MREQALYTESTCANLGLAGTQLVIAITSVNFYFYDINLSTYLAGFKLSVVGSLFYWETFLSLYSFI